MQNYNDLIRDTQMNGTESDDRTGVGTVKMIGTQLRFDLSKGFPAVTTKKLAMKTLVAELMFFMQPIPDRRLMQEYQFGNFKEDRFDIWKGNCLDKKSSNPIKFNGYNLGNMYPVYWRRKPSVSEKWEMVKIPTDIDAGNYFNSEYDYKNDPLLGDCEKLYKKMMSEFVSGDCTISARWMVFGNFVSDIRTIPFFYEYLENPNNYVLDCSYYGSGIHSRSTTIFLRKDILEQIKNDTGRRYIEDVDSNRNYPIGRDTSNLNVFVRHTPDGYIFRPKLFTDQLQELIDGIKQVKENPHHPVGRRLIMDSWNPNWEDDSVLGICHPWVQCFVNDGKLSLMFTMR